MRALHSMLAEPWLNAFGWALIHFLWQGTLVGCLLALVMSALNRRSPDARYVASVIALALMAALPVATTLTLRESLGRAQPFEQAGASLQTEPASDLPESVSARPRGASTRAKNQAWQRQVFERVENLMPWLVLVWLIGVLSLLIRFMGGLIHARRLKRRRSRPAPPVWQQTLERLARQLRVSRPVCLLESALAQAPMTIGWVRPVILLPVSAFTGLTEEHLRAILAHELAHIRRHDYLINLLQSVVEIMLFYHPAVWWVSRQVRVERENCCDDLAVSACGDPVVYARALTQIERLRKAAPRVGVAANGGMLMNRIQRIIGVQTTDSNRFAAPLVVTAVVLALVVGAGARTTMLSSSASVEDGKAATEAVRGEASREGGAQSAIHAMQAPGGKAIARKAEPVAAAQASVSESAAGTAPTPASGQQETLPEGVREMVSALGSSNPAERAAAACSLGRAGDVRAIPFLLAMLADDAAIEMTKCWDEATWNPALSSFKSPSPGEQAAIALAAMGKAAVQPLVDALSHTDSGVRRNAAWAIGEIRGSHGVDRADAVGPLINLLKDEDAWTRKAAAFSLGEIRDRRATEALIAALDDGSPNVRETAAWALGEMKESRAVQRLSAALLTDAEWSVRSRIAWALGEIKDPLAVEALTSALNDDNNRVRSTAKWALSEILD